MDNNENQDTLTNAIKPLADGAHAASSALASLALEASSASISEISARRTAEMAVLAIEKFCQEMLDIMAARQYIKDILDGDGGQGGVPRKRHIAKLYATSKSPKTGRVLAAMAKAVADEAYSRGFRDEKVAEVVPEEYLRQYFTLSSVRKKRVAEALREGDSWEAAMLRV